MRDVHVDPSQLRSVCLALGPYRNLTTLTAGILSLHPQCQVLNHAGVRLLPDPERNFLADPIHVVDLLLDLRIQPWLVIPELAQEDLEGLVRNWPLADEVSEWSGQRARQGLEVLLGFQIPHQPDAVGR